MALDPREDGIGVRPVPSHLRGEGMTQETIEGGFYRSRGKKLGLG